MVSGVRFDCTFIPTMLSLPFMTHWLQINLSWSNREQAIAKPPCPDELIITGIKPMCHCIAMWFCKIRHFVNKHKTFIIWNKNLLSQPETQKTEKNKVRAKKEGHLTFWRILTHRQIFSEMLQQILMVNGESMVDFASFIAALCFFLSR